MLPSKEHNRPELMLTVGHRTFSAQFLDSADRLPRWPPKRPSNAWGGRWTWDVRCSILSSSQVPHSATWHSSGASQALLLLRNIRYRNQRWIAESDKTLSTATWLVYEIDRTNRSRVVSLKCLVCARYSQKLVGMRNYNSAFVEGTSNLRTSSFKDHASSEMHARAMQLHKKQVKRPFNSVYGSNECFSYTGIN